MAFQNGVELVEAIADTLNRGDLNNRIPQWISIAEKSISRVLRVDEMIGSAFITFDAPIMGLPSNFIEMQTVQINTANGPKSLLYAPKEDLNFMRRLRQGGGEPSHFQIEGKSMEISPWQAGHEVQMRYFGAIPPLDVTSTTSPNASNWLLEKAPDAYLYSALIHSGPYLHEDERTQVWTQLAAAVVESLNEEARRAGQAGSRLNTRPKTFG